MTDNYIRRAANALPNKHEDATALTVEQIMRERGVGRRQAYFRLRQMRGEQDTQVPVPANQRDRVLVTLYRANGSITDSRVLTQALHEGGYNIDGHDTTKTLWSLQKTNHVKFRERSNPRYLYGIHLTAQGKAEGKRLTTEKKQEEEAPEPITVESEPVIPTEVLKPFFPEPYQYQYEPEPEPEPEPLTPWIKGDLPPALRELRERWLKATKLYAAAQLLEAAGEIEVAVSLYDKTKFTELEEEVIDLLRHLKEIE